MKLGSNENENWQVFKLSLSFGLKLLICTLGNSSALSSNLNLACSNLSWEQSAGKSRRELKKTGSCNFLPSNSRRLLLAFGSSFREYIRWFISQNWQPACRMRCGSSRQHWVAVSTTLKISARTKAQWYIYRYIYLTGCHN